MLQPSWAAASGGWSQGQDRESLPVSGGIVSRRRLLPEERGDRESSVLGVGGDRESRRVPVWIVSAAGALGVS